MYTCIDMYIYYGSCPRTITSLRLMVLPGASTALSRPPCPRLGRPEFERELPARLPPLRAIRARCDRPGTRGAQRSASVFACPD